MLTADAGAMGYPQRQQGSLVQRLAEIAREYPSAIAKHELEDVERIAYHIELVQRYAKDGRRICDIGGGIGLFTPGCAALGYDTTLVDDFRDDVNLRNGDGVFTAHKKFGVTVISCDVVTQPLAFASNSFDVITTFDSMEHWHHSPKRLFHMLKKALTAEGILIIGVPNCNNLLKRVRTMLGKGHWSPMKDWYEPEVFRAHVREPSVSDLRYICNDLDMNIVTIIGRNWLGRENRPFLQRVAPILQMRPGLCSDLYLVASKRPDQ